MRREARPPRRRAGRRLGRRRRHRPRPCSPRPASTCSSSRRAPDVRQGDVVPFSLEQMDRQYRAGGVTAALGFPSIAYTEGAAPAAARRSTAGCTGARPRTCSSAGAAITASPTSTRPSCTPSATRSRRSSRVQPVPGRTTPASEALRRGARPPRVAPRRDPALDDVPDRRRRRRRPPAQHDRDLPAPRRRRPGPGCSPSTASTASSSTVDAATPRRASRCPTARPATVDFAHVDRVRRGDPDPGPAAALRAAPTASARTLAVHPTVKLAARFADAINVPDDVPVHQVKEFAPDLSFGGSASGPGSSPSP